MALDDDIEIRVILRDELSRPAERIQEGLGELQDEMRRLQSQTRELSDEQDHNTESTEQNEQSVRANSQARDKHGRFIRQNTEDTDSNTTATKRNTKANDSNTKSIQKTAKGFGSLSKLMMPIKILAIADAAGKASAGVLALGGAGVAAVAGLAPLSGLVLPLPSMLAGAGMAAITAKLAFGGLGKAASALNSGDWKAFAEATKDMGPNAVEAAKGLAKFTDTFKPIKGMVQEKVLEGMGDTIRDIGEKYFPIANSAMGKAADGMKGVLGYTTGFFQLNSTIESMGRIFDKSATMSTLFGHAANGVIRSLVGVMDATGDVGIRMAQDISDGMNKLGDLIANNGDRIGAFADRAYSLFKRVIGVIVDFAKAFGNIGKLSMEVAGIMGGGLEDMARKFREWTQSVQGQQKIKDFFESIKPVLSSLAGLVKTLGEAFVGIGMANMGSLPGTIDKITSMVPTFQSIIEKANGMVPALLDIAGAILQIVDGGDMLTPFGILMESTAPIIEGMAAAFTALPGPIQEAIGYMVLFGLAVHSAATGGALGFLMKIGFIAKAVGILTTYLKVAQWAVIAFGKTFLTFLVSNPIGWIILAVIALVAVFVILWKKCEAFRNIVKAIGQWFVDVWNNTLFPIIMRVWEWMQEAWDKVYEIVKGVVMAVVNWFRENWDTIKAVVMTTWQVIQTAFSIAWNIIKTYVTLWWTVVKFAFNIIWNVVSFVVKAIIAYWKFMWSIVQNVVWPVIKVIISFIKGMWEIIKSIIGLIVAIFNVGWNIIRVIVGVVVFAIVKWIQFIWPYIQAGINLAISIFKFGWNIISTVVMFAINLIKSWIGFLWPYIQAGINIAVTIFQTGWNIISTVVGAVVDFIKMCIGWISDRVSSVMDTSSSIFSTVWDTISGFVGTAIDKIKGFIQGVADFISPVLNGIKSVWDSVWGGIETFVMGILDRIKGAIDGIKGVVDTVGNAIGGVADFLGFYAGGTVTVGMRAMVGELGPEAFVSNSGKVTGIGMKGPEMMNFPTSGYVVPNHVLHGVKDSSVPNHVMQKLGNHVAEKNGGYETGTATPRKRAESNDNYMGKSGGATTVQVIIQGNVTENVEIEKAVKKALDAAERNKRERK